MKLSLLTYNLLLNKASKEMSTVLLEYKPDLVCFQEIATDDDSLKVLQIHGYQLADFSNSFVRSGKIYGVATFYKSALFSMVDSKSFNLPNNIYQIVSFILHNNRNPRTVLKNVFESKKSGKRLTVYNVHLTPLATNGLRIRQIYNTFGDLKLNEPNPVLIAGDFNYPYGRKKLESILKEYDLKEATDNVYFTLERKIISKLSIKLKLDYILYKGLQLISNKKIEIRHSDHFPILATFDL